MNRWNMLSRLVSSQSPLCRDQCSLSHKKGENGFDQVDKRGQMCVLGECSNVRRCDAECVFHLATQPILPARHTLHSLSLKPSYSATHTWALNAHSQVKLRLCFHDITVAMTHKCTPRHSKDFSSTKSVRSTQPHANAHARSQVLHFTI